MQTLVLVEVCRIAKSASVLRQRLARSSINIDQYISDKKGLMMTLPDWNSRDYEVDFPDIVIPPNTPTVDTPLPYKVGIVVRSLLGDILPDAQRATRYEFELAGLFVALAAIDYLAGYYVGRKTTGNDYKAFMRKYFPEKYYPYIDAIYKQIRCGLMHNLVPLDPWRGGNQFDFLIQGKSLLHLVESNEKISFSVPIFIEDTRRAFIVYQHELIMHPDENPKLVRNFEKRFGKLGGKASAMLKVPDE